MDMVTPPVVADLPTEVAAGMVERDGGLLDDDVTVVGNASHDQDPAVIMMAHSTCAVYADFNVQVLGEKSHDRQRVEQPGGRWASRLRKNYVGRLELRWSAGVVQQGNTIAG